MATPGAPAGGTAQDIFSQAQNKAIILLKLIIEKAREPESRLEPRLLQLVDAVKRLGRRSGVGPFVKYDKSSTPKAFTEIKDHVQELDRLPPHYQLLTFGTGRLKELLGEIQWKFDDAYDAIDFLGCYGRDYVFNKQRTSFLTLYQTIGEDRGCCMEATYEGEGRCSHGTTTCLICMLPSIQVGSDDDNFDAFLTKQLEPSALFAASPPSFVSDQPGHIPSVWLQDGYSALERPACEHAQRDRFLSLVATRTIQQSQGKTDPSQRGHVTYQCHALVKAWSNVQSRKGWDIHRDLTNMPLSDRNYPVSIPCDGGQSLQFTMHLSTLPDGRRRLMYLFVGELELMI